MSEREFTEFEAELRPLPTIQDQLNRIANALQMTVARHGTEVAERAFMRLVAGASDGHAPADRVAEDADRKLPAIREELERIADAPSAGPKQAPRTLRARRHPGRPQAGAISACGSCGASTTAPTDLGGGADYRPAAARVPANE